MKQLFNLSQEKIDQLFRHCIFNLTPKDIGHKQISYYSSDNTYRYKIQWTEKDDNFYYSGLSNKITENLFESDNLKFRIIIYRIFKDDVLGEITSNSIALNVSDLEFEELQKVKSEIYNIYKNFYNDLLESAPCELSSIEAHPRVIKPNE